MEIKWCSRTISALTVLRLSIVGSERDWVRQGSSWHHYIWNALQAGECLSVRSRGKTNWTKIKGNQFFTWLTAMRKDLIFTSYIEFQTPACIIQTTFITTTFKSCMVFWRNWIDYFRFMVNRGGPILWQSYFILENWIFRIETTVYFGALSQTLVG